MKIFAGALIAIAIQILPFAAAAECPPLGKVDWWTNSIDEVRQTVAQTYKGNWDDYIARWQQMHRQLQVAYDKGDSVTIKSRQITLVGDELKGYIANVSERIAVFDCLRMETFDTAAGGLKVTEEAKVIEAQDLSLKIAPVCHDGVPAFQVTNLGERWPRTAEVVLYRTDGDSKVTQRRVRLANDQQMMFKVPEAAAKDIGEAGIFIQPSWYERPFSYDARTKC